jgi:hypothetical protein
MVKHIRVTLWNVPFVLASKTWMSALRIMSTPSNRDAVGQVPVSSVPPIQEVTYPVWSRSLFWVVTPCSVVVRYHRFGGPCLPPFSFPPEDGGSMDPWKVRILRQNYTASQPRRPQYETSPSWKSQKVVTYPDAQNCSLRRLFIRYMTMNT